MSDNEYVDAAEQAEADDQSVGAGTPDTAPHEIPMDDEDSDVDETTGIADSDDDDVVEDNGTPVEAEV